MQTAAVHFRIKKNELGLAAILAGFWAVFLFFQAGGPRTWDEFFYLDMSLKMKELAWCMNRFGHIYALKLFVFMARDAFEGARLYASFASFFTVFFTYVAARILSHSDNPFSGILAVFLLFSQKLIYLLFSGSILADFGVMLWVQIAVLIYLLLPALGQDREKWGLALLGTAMTFAFKTKESGICLLPLLAGLSFGKEINARRFMIRWGWVSLGAVIAILSLMILDGIFLGDPFFSYRGSNIMTAFHYVFPSPDTRPGRQHLIKVMVKTGGFLPLFFLYVLGFLMPRGKSWQNGEKFIGIIPMLVFFLSVVYMLGMKFGTIFDRYFAPAVPLMAAFAVQPLPLRNSCEGGGGEKTKGRFSACFIEFLSLAGAWIFAFFLSRGFLRFGAQWLWPEAVLYADFLEPMALVLMLSAFALWQNPQGVRRFLVFVLLFMMMMGPVTRHAADLITAHARSETAYALTPLTRYKSKIRLTDQTLLYYDNALIRQYGYGYGGQTIKRLMNIFFNRKGPHLHCHQDHPLSAVFRFNFDYAFLAEESWKELAAEHGEQALKEKYVVDADPQHHLFFLRARHPRIPREFEKIG